MSVLKLLANDSFITYNKIIAKQFGVNSAILLGALCGFQNSFGNVEFYKEQERISDDTCLSVYEIQQATKQLVGAGILEVKRKGIPAKNYYYVVDIKLSKILTSSDENFTHQEVKKVNDYINNNTTTNNTNNNILKGEAPTTQKELTKTNMKRLADYTEILNYWNSKDIIQHKELTEQLIRSAYKATSRYSVSEIKTYIDRYKQVLSDSNYFFKYKWSLSNFLSRDNGISDFTDSGCKWLDYCSKTNKPSGNSGESHGMEVD